MITNPTYEALKQRIKELEEQVGRRNPAVAPSESEAFLRKVLDSSVAGLYLYDLKRGINVFINQQYTVLTGYTLDGINSMSGSEFAALFHPEDRARVLDHMHAVARAADGETVEIEYRFRTADGRWIWCFSRDTVFSRDADGSVRQFLGTFLDATARKEAEAALRQSREDLDRAQAVGQIGWWRLDTRSNLLTWSDETYRIFGVSHGTPMTYESFLRIVHPDDRQYVDAQWNAGLRGEPYDIEHRIVTDGQVKWVREKAYLEFGESGELQGGFGITQDITERRQAEEEVRRKQSEIQALFDHSPAGLVLFDAVPPYRVLVHNRYYQELFAEPFKSRGMVGLNICDYAPEVEAAGVVAVFDEVVRTKQAKSFLDFPYKSNPPNETWFNWHMAPIILDGKVVSLVSMSIDVTDSHRAEEALRRAKELSDALNRIDEAVHSTLDLGEILRRLVSEGATALGSDTAAISLREDNGWRPCYTYGMPIEGLETRMSDDQERHTMLAIESRQPVVVEDAYNDERFNRRHFRRYRIRSVLVVPLIIRDKPLGALFFNYHSARQTFSEVEVNFARRLAASAATAMENAEAFDELKRAEEALREAKEQLAQALRAANMGVWRLDLRKQEREFDGEGFRCLGIDPARFAGTEEEFYAAVHPDDRDRLKSALTRTIATGAPYKVEYRVVWPGGNVRHIDSRAQLTRDSSGQPQRIDGLVWDITDQKRAEIALGEAEQKYRELVQYAPAAIYEIDFRTKRFTSVNDAMCHMVGYSREELLTMNPFDLLDERSQAIFQSRITRWISGEEPDRNVEYKARAKDGHMLDAILNVTFTVDANGRPLGATVVGYDITERKRMEDELRKSRDELELRVRERTAELQLRNQELHDFAFVASHDLNEPLRKIRAFGDMVTKRLEDFKDEESKDYLMRMQTAAARMQTLLDSLLSYSRVTTKAEAMKKTDLRRSVKEALSNLEIMMAEKNGKVEIGDLPTIRADAVQMTQLFQNLIGNALKFHGDGETPQVKIHAEEAREAYQIYVEDKGIGFEEKYLEKIFLPFQRLHGRSSQYEGVGMGLAICRKIVERHGGKITARSKPGKGSTFIVTLPTKREVL